MTDPTWIHIPNWEKFQHYHDRRPAWIKVYIQLLKNPDYLGLSHASRGLLQLIWLAYAEMDGACTIDDLRMLGRHRVYISQLEALNQAGFIQLSSRRVLAVRSIEKEKEIEKDLKPFHVKSRPVHNRCSHCGLTFGPRKLAEHLYQLHDGPEPDHWLEAEARAHANQ